LTANTIFHEIGHAIDGLMGQKKGLMDLYSASEQRYDLVNNGVEANVRTTVTSRVNSMFPTLNTATKNLYIDYLTYKIMNENIPGAIKAEVRYSIPASDMATLDALYINIRNDYRNRTSIVSAASRNTYMWVVSDMYGGITNNNIVDGAGHVGSSWYAPDSTYWYNPNGTPIKRRVCELWAGYVAAIVTDMPNTNAVMDEFFPGYNAPSLTKEMLAFLTGRI
jgi:hypothetical protein